MWVDHHYFDNLQGMPRAKGNDAIRTKNKAQGRVKGR